MVAVPGHDARQSLVERDAGCVPELSAGLGDVRTAPLRAPLQERAWAQLDGGAERARHRSREIRDRGLDVGPKIIDLAVLAALDHALEATRKIVDVDERPRLGAVALNRKGDRFRRSALRDER